jgi:hypothetical protein
MGFPIAHDQGVALIVAQMAQGLSILLDFELQSSSDHAPGSFSGQFVQ